MEIAYLIPEFPSQTHVFFWRERIALQGIGVTTHLVSTRRPSTIAPHDWSVQATLETVYLIDFKLNEIPRLVASFIGFGPRAWARVFTAAIQDCPLKHWFTNFALVIIATRLVRYMREMKLTHVHSHSCGDSALVAMFANRLGGVSYSLTLHADLRGFGRQQALKWRYATFAVTVTEGLRDQVRRELSTNVPSQIAVAPMGVDANTFKRSEPYKPWRRDGALRLFSCGRLNLAKGHQDLIHAVSKLVESGLNVQLEIAGEDQAGGNGFRRELTRLIENLQLTDNVRLLGAISENHILECLKAAHLFVLASHHEARSVATMEALSCEVPVVATNVGGFPELIDHGVDGYLVPPREPTKMAKAIALLALNPSLAISFSAVGRQKILEHFSSTSSAREIKNQLDHIQGAGNPRTDLVHE